MTCNKIALIFGISGQDGAYLAHLLLSQGYEVHGVSRDAGNSPFERLVRLGIMDRVSLHSGDLSEFRSIINLLSKVQPTEIYNLAGQSSVALSFELPVETFESVAVATVNILEYLRLTHSPIRYFQAVSSECFGNTIGRANEDTPFRPRSPYAMAKAAAYWTGKIYREAYGLHICSGILSNHDSPLRPARFVTRKIVRAAVAIARGSKERLALGNVQVERDWGWAPEYVEAMWRMMQHERCEDYVIATGETSSLQDFMIAVFEKLGLEWQEHLDIDASLLRPSEVSRTELETARARTVLGWSARSKMRDVAALLVESEMGGKLGPVPWATEELP